MKKSILYISLLVISTSCSNSYDLETGEITALQLLETTMSQINNKNTYLDARDLINRRQIDAAGIPVLFVELETGQNGTLTPYPGEGVGQTWLGADGATITLDNGVLIASRGMGEDVMGATTQLPAWAEISTSASYKRQFGYLSGNNQSYLRSVSCQIKKE